MTNSSAVQLDRKYLQSPPKEEEEEEGDTSDDSEVSVANMNRHATKEVRAEEDNDEEYSGTNVEGENEILSDDEYVYSEDSLCSDDSCRESEITNVTPTSSPSLGSPLTHTMSLEFPVRRQVEEIARAGSTPPHEILDNTRGNIRRMCSSASDNRHSIANEHGTDTAVHARTRRRNMSFTNAEMRKIELENQYLLKKIMAQQKPQNKPMRAQSAQPMVSSSAINRRKLQKKIEEENMMLLRRIQDAKSCALSTNAIPGYRLTSL